MNKKLLFLLMFVFSLGLTFTACSDDDDPVNVSLEKSETNVDQGATVTVKITQGNGDYQVSSASEATATASISDDVVTITGVAAGETTITITDKDKKTATLKVTVVGYAEQIAATYNGDLTITLPGGSPIPIEDKDVVLEKSTDNKAKVTLKDFSFGDVLDLGDIPVDGISVTKEGSTYTLSETTAVLQLPVGEGGALQDVSVTMSGTVEDGKTELTITVTDVFPMPIAVAFEGTKKAN